MNTNNCSRLVFSGVKKKCASNDECSFVFGPFRTWPPLHSKRKKSENNDRRGTKFRVTTLVVRSSSYTTHYCKSNYSTGGGHNLYTHRRQLNLSQHLCYNYVSVGIRPVRQAEPNSGTTAYRRAGSIQLRRHETRRKYRYGMHRRDRSTPNSSQPE